MFVFTGNGLSNPNASDSIYNYAESLIKSTSYVLLPDKKSTLCQIELITGYTVNGISSTINSQTFDSEIGRILSHKKAMSAVCEVAAILKSEKIYQDLQKKNKDEVNQFFQSTDGSHIYQLLYVAKQNPSFGDVAVFKNVRSNMVYVQHYQDFIKRFDAAKIQTNAERELSELESEYSRLLGTISQFELKASICSQIGLKDQKAEDLYQVQLRVILLPLRDYHERLLEMITDLKKNMI